MTLNGTVLATQAGLKITTQTGDVSIKETLGYDNKDAEGKEVPDSTLAVGSVQVKAGGKITIDKDWNIAGVNRDNSITETMQFSEPFSPKTKKT